MCDFRRERGALLRVDPIGPRVERVAAGDVTVSWPIPLGPAKLAFQSRGQLAVLDLAARRGVWLTLPEGSRLAGDGLASLAYERNSNATNVMVFAEP